MRLKTFTAPTTAQAMAQIRAVLGGDAVIVATQDEGDGVRVTAALEAPDTPPLPAATTTATAPDMIDAVYDGLRRNGIPAPIGEALMELVEGFETSDPVTALAAALRQFFRFRPLEATSRRQARMLVGPPGAGKTQAVAKLAARAVTANRRVALFTTDCERAGGDARLAGLAAAMALPAMAVDDPDTLADGLAGVDGYDLVLIDSAGANHLDVEEMAGLGRYLLCGDIEAVLVMLAGIDLVEAGDIGLVFGELGVGRMISTRLDLTRRLGSVLAAADAAKLAFAEIGNTARIKDGLIAADPVILARFVLAAGPAAHIRHTGA